MIVDRYKVAHWMNARKQTAAQVAVMAGVADEVVLAMLGAEQVDLDLATVGAVAAAMRIDPTQLGSGPQGNLTVIVQPAAGLYATRRPIERDGIHFYNYYSMAGPHGRVAPVILDILCPSGRLPALNNGHLEPAITVNLGPGDIHGRWGTELNPDTWQVLAVNSGDDTWITGDSYVEPSYCPHSYSLASDRPARIVSYTGQSNVVALVNEVNTWSAAAFDGLLDFLKGGLPCGDVLDILLARHGYDRVSAAASAGVDLAAVQAAIEDPPSHVGTLRTLCRAVGLDYRTLLPPERRHDQVGKTCLDVTAARASRRRFAGYEVASMASAPHLPDLSGLFLNVEDDGGDLAEPAESHYLVVDGEVTLHWLDDVQHRSALLAPDASAWVGPFVRHRFCGRGGVLKFGSGSHLGYLDFVELTNTFTPDATLRRSRRDVSGWGYDK
jgi:2-hydroxyethylphosphonate dioxygenase